MRKNTERPQYNYYRMASSSSIIRLLMGGDERLYHGEWAEIIIDDVNHLIIHLSKRDAAASPSLTTTLDITNTGLVINGSAEPGFYSVTEVTDYHPDGTVYTAFCTGRRLYRCAVDFQPAHRIRLDRRVKKAPVTVGDLEKLISKAVNDEDLKRALTNLLKEEDNMEGKKKNSKPPKPAPTE